MHTFWIRWFIIVLVGLSLPSYANELLEMKVINQDTGRALQTYPYHGKTYVAGQPDQRYAIRLTNRTQNRILAIVSVDGINAISGETASPKQAGYVLSPYQQMEVAGWRKSDTEIAQFYFTSLPDSYAARTDRPDNVGIIGVAVYREKEPLPPPPMMNNQYDGNQPSRHDSQESNRGHMGEASAGRMAAVPSAAAPMKQAERLGTGHGERQYDPVTTTTFRRASDQPAEIVALRYDSTEHLIQMGVIRRPKHPPEPQAFPNQYVPDPPRR
ncbi:MAG: hypothetical protein PHU06_03505 [Gallionella sp.]|nr:hypothetical protein [Gallionella sp.]MDD4958346.1 hypothetical protein [Gallionella sp.]